ncbi:MAG: hypothetical protein ACOYNZ_14830 [Rhodoferax sp.]
MSWSLSKYSSSVMGLFGRSAPDMDAGSRIVGIRKAMLDEMADVSESNKLTRVYVRVYFAPDIQALWYLRCDVMTLLAMRVGESDACRRIATTTAMFNGLMPSTQKSRLSSLHH